MTVRRRKPTMYDVAQLAGVSQTTVSFILSGRLDGDDRISDETRGRVMQAVARLGYVPNQAARSLRKQRTERVALYIDRLGTPYFELLGQTLQVAAERRGYSLVLLMGRSEGQQRRAVETLHQGLVDGVFFTNLHNISGDEIRRLALAGMAVVVYNNVLQIEGIDYVRYPAFDAAKNEVAYLAKKGHTQIGFIGFQQNIDEWDTRYEGYLEGMSSHGLNPMATLADFEAWLSRARIYEHAVKLLKQPQRPTALICGSDFGAVCAMAAAQDMGLRIPQDVAIMGMGNIPESSYVRPALSTMGPDPLDFSPAVDLLFDRLEGKAPDQGREWKMDWKLIERNST